jgi:hypothetical protein
MQQSLIDQPDILVETCGRKVMGRLRVLVCMDATTGRIDRQACQFAGRYWDLVQLMTLAQVADPASSPVWMPYSASMTRLKD